MIHNVIAELRVYGAMYIPRKITIIINYLTYEYTQHLKGAYYYYYYYWQPA